MIKRTLFEALTKHLSQPEISLIVGPRQAGKTTLMLHLKEYLESKGYSTLFLSLDFESDLPNFASQQALIQKLILEFGDSKGYVFIDEIQRKENAGLFLKGIYDQRLPYKFIVSGSGSLELKEKIHESLIGRKRLFELTTVTLEEFINFKTSYRYADRLYEYCQAEKTKVQEILYEYLNFGGYPRLIMEKRLDEKIRIIDEIYRSYLEKDVTSLLKVEKLDAFRMLVRILADQTGKLINFAELSSTIGISTKTLKKYFEYLEKTFIIQRVTPFYKNIRKELSKSPVVYFMDMGLRNYALGMFGHVSAPSQSGFLFQNLIFNILKEKTRFSPITIHFWRTKDRAEVDFVLTAGTEPLPVEVKFSNMKTPAITRSLRNFIKKYRPEEAWIVNLGLNTELQVESTRIKFLPFHELVTQDPTEQNYVSTKFMYRTC